MTTPHPCGREYANVDRRDLGVWVRLSAEEEPELPRGTTFALRAQIDTMQSSFYRLGLGMILAVLSSV
jgi:hypothetical protein